MADISGEVQSTNSSVSVGYHALNITMDLPDEIERNRLDKYECERYQSFWGRSSRESDGTGLDLETTGPSLSLAKVVRTDQHILVRERHKGRFFYDPFEDEWDPRTWEKDKNMLDAKIKTSSNKMADLKPLQGLPPGRYLVELKAKMRLWNGVWFSSKGILRFFGAEDGMVPFPNFLVERENHVGTRRGPEYDVRLFIWRCRGQSSG